MDYKPRIQNAVAAIRVSTTKQGTQGDSPEAQKEQIERFALARGIKIKKLFLFLESASKEQQPMQEAIDYCKNPKHKIDLFIVKSIDRFTRGGSYSYSQLKMQLDNANVHLMDIHGIIGAQKVNTLEHLGISYKWSVYDPTKNSEILEAERASDEKRDIMTRMIGAQIRYARLGYWVRRAPLGYINVHVETINGNRSILEPHPITSPWILKMFELRCRGTLDDHEIVREVNMLGFRTPANFLRHKQDKTRIISKRGGAPLTLKTLHAYLGNPAYAGVNAERWLMGQAVRCKFAGLVSIEIFNKANRGRVAIVEDGHEVRIEESKMESRVVKTKFNPMYPYKRVVGCSICGALLFGSAAKNRYGKQYPAYHCDRRRSTAIDYRYHYFRERKANFDATIEEFIKLVYIETELEERLIDAVMTLWDKRIAESQRDQRAVNLKVGELKMQAEMVAEKIKFLSSEVTVKYLEEDLMRIEAQMNNIGAEQTERVTQYKHNRETIIREAKKLIERPDMLILHQAEPVQQANFFGLLFDRVPKYSDLVAVLNDQTIDIGLNELFTLRKS
jgi:hypothetical protein